MKNNLKKQLLQVSILPLVLMLLVVVAFSMWTMYNSITSEVEDNMKKTSDLVLLMYDKVYPGDWSLSVDSKTNTYTVYKGDVDITTDFEFLEEIAATQEAEITIFCRNVRVLTTLKNEDGARFITTKASPVVERDVLDTGKGVFYKNVSVGDTASYAYYTPIYLTDGPIFGMIGVCRSSEKVKQEAFTQMCPLLLVCAFVAFIIGFVIISYTKKITARISEIDKFMNSVAAGKFNADMSQIVGSKDDELARLATNSRKMTAEIRKLVEYDALTGIHNRRYGDKRLMEAQDKASRHNNPFCVCMCDIDFFKKVNDTYGHEAGDDVLKAVTSIINDSVKSKGFVARWGGEEFLIVFENTDLPEAKSILELTLDRIRENEVVSNTEAGLQTIKVTMSFGVTTGTYHEKNDGLLKRADGLLYEAKTTGRNQVIARSYEDYKEVEEA
ncbi:MAG: diguanylate cyclase [Pseudobutyrivibrio sp.]|nr:diguanylate cyclase [Pseudobutyrivibrio sp.]